jgi:hypothetical protein
MHNNQLAHYFYYFIKKNNKFFKLNKNFYILKIDKEYINYFLLIIKDLNILLLEFFYFITRIYQYLLKIKLL